MDFKVLSGRIRSFKYLYYFVKKILFLKNYSKRNILTFDVYINHNSLLEMFPKSRRMPVVGYDPTNLQIMSPAQSV